MPAPCARHGRTQKCEGLWLCRGLLRSLSLPLRASVQCRNLPALLGTRGARLLSATSPLYPRPCLVSPGQPSPGLVSRATPLVACPLLAQVLAGGQRRRAAVLCEFPAGLHDRP